MQLIGTLTSDDPSPKRESFLHMIAENFQPQSLKLREEKMFMEEVKSEK